MKSLIIVESPTKAKTISKFLGSNYKVESSFGHVRDLPEKKLGIKIAENFLPEYVIPLKAKPTIKKLKEIAKKTDEVILATDEDREGEAIAWHLAQALHLKEGEKRIVFHEITKSAIENALKHPRSLDMNLVDAQQARRILDRLVGYKLSPFLWKKVAKGLSAGRVQSVTLRLIVERENEIRNFIKQEYWTINAELRIKNKELGGVVATLFKIGDKILEKFDIPNQEEAEKITGDLKKQDYIIAKIERKELRRNPPTPFTTSTLQQEAAKRLGYSSKRTMLLAQRLYENGLITYMRTDSTNLSSESLTAAKIWITKELGKKYAAQAPRIFQTKSKLAQEAHEAVRPTHVDNVPENFSGDESERKVYKLIWQRFVASQLPQAVFDTTTIIIQAGERYALKTTGMTLRFDGYLKIWPQKFAALNNQGEPHPQSGREEKELPQLKEKEQLTLKDVLPEQHFTEPPARYSEATLIKTLEEKGIGRPSTYAPTISTIQTRNYVIKEERRFKPTEIGELVNKVLTENFPEVIDMDFTAKMEDSLDAVADGKEQWQDLLGAFYTPFSKNLEEKYLAVKKENLIPQETGEKCEKCGKPMVIRMSRFGKFMACSGFPDCRNTKKLPSVTGDASHPERSEGSPGSPPAIQMKCPKCNDGEVVERRTKKSGRRFWGCSVYPKCDWASWKNPTLTESPN